MEGYHLCDSCFDECYTHCIMCNRILSIEDACFEDEEEYYCDRCYNQEYNGALRAHNFSTKPLFLGEGIFYGVELEVDRGGQSTVNAGEVLEVANFKGNHLYIKRDPSLAEGFEVVSHPMSLYYHCNEMCWEDVLNKLWKLGYSSQETLTCGYHIHVGRKGLGSTLDEQEASIANIICFVDNHWEQLVRFSRRSLAEIEHWATRYASVDGHNTALEHAKKGNPQRYTCVNLQNSETIEFRIFKGTLKHALFIACLQLVDELCTKIAKMNSTRLSAYTWTEFVLDIDVEKKSMG